MNTRFSTYPYPPRLPAGGVLPQMIGKFVRSIEHAVRLRRDRAILSEMPDHLLRDIGVSRSDILSVTRFHKTDSTRRQSN